MRNFKNFVFASLILSLGLVATSCKKDSGDSPAPEVPAPTITSISPTTACIGDVVTIVGTNFSTRAGENVVKFGAVTATITEFSATQIKVTVPDQTGEFAAIQAVKVTTNSKDSGTTDFTYRCRK